MNVGITTSKQATFYYLRVSQLFLPNLKQGLPQFEIEIVGLRKIAIYFYVTIRQKLPLSEQPRRKVPTTRVKLHQNIRLNFLFSFSK